MGLNKLKILFLMLFVAAGISSSAWGEGSEKKDETKPKEKTKVEDIVVKDKLESPATGKSVISKEFMDSLLSGNGSINEMVEILPDIQVSDDNVLGENSAEIKPSNISISGGRFYENNFIIDGMGNNSYLDPGSEETSHVINDVEGHPQAIFLGSELVKEITVYDSNVPAEYGGFTGGVVSAETKDPGFEWHGSFKYRGTKSSWTKYHVEKNDDFDFSKKEPEFEKEEITTTISGPITKKTGVLASYRRLTSSEPERHFLGSKSNERSSESFFTKFTSDLTDTSVLKASFTYSPYKNETYLQDVKNSDYTIEGGGAAFNASYNRYIGGGELEIKTGVSQSENSRKSPQHYYSWAATNTKPWGKDINQDYSKEGGYGDIEKTQTAFNLASSYKFEDFEALKGNHEIKTGFSFEAAQGEYNRKDLTYLYTGAASGLPNLECRPDQEIDSIPGEQFFTSRKVFSPSKATVDINSFAAYVQDTIRMGRFIINPGVRLEYDDYMENFNFSPRFSASYDIFNNRKTILTMGANRYYARSLMTYGLREARKPYLSQIRSSYHNVVQEWEDASGVGSNATEFSKLKTPYSDELAFGLDQKLFKGLLSVKYVQREGRDEFARQYDQEPAKDGIRYYTMTNNGESSHKSYRLSWTRSWVNHSIMFYGTYQETDSSNENYDTNLDDTTSDYVWSIPDKKAMPRTELPKNNYNRPLKLALVYTGKLPKGFYFTNITKYTGSYENLEDTGKKTEYIRYDGNLGEYISEDIPVYGEVSYDAVLTFDWKLGWKKEFKNKMGFEFMAEIENVFDARQTSDKYENKYVKGRQFWAGCSVFF